jgi:thioredoxin reductase (NADPH)
MAEREVDLLIVGGGPAGLSAGINAVYEGLETLVLDGQGRFGGQAWQAAWIENYAGFPEGISGYDLVSNMLDQGARLEAKYRAPFRVEEITKTDEGFSVSYDEENIVGRSVLLSCGVDYRRHNASNLAVYLDRGVTYGAPHRSAIYQDQKIMVVGGGNNAGQAALKLARMSGCEVDLLIRGPELRKKMSATVADKVEKDPNIKVHLETEITSAQGESKGDERQLTSVTVKEKGHEREMPTDQIFLLLGAIPRTRWLPEQVARDSLGFILAGRQLDPEVRERFEGECGRAPMDRETSVPGLFTVGDVRSGTVKRVASATGDGAIVIPEIYEHLNR